MAGAPSPDDGMDVVGALCAATPARPGTASRSRSGAAGRFGRVRGPKTLGAAASTSQVPAMNRE
ncbi:hypothetical protein [Streptomyces mutabilis]|uniref:hypothetical protein n=1 Tax=Streptomyces mutabilis TaxID=67332 RepID=UPI0011462D2A|nr:hypothetical protein [Streptomyces mutabilis]